MENKENLDMHPAVLERLLDLGARERWPAGTEVLSLEPEQYNDKIPFLCVMKDDGTPHVLDLEACVATAPRLATGVMTTPSVESFCLYVNQQKTESTRIFVSADALTARAVFDFHGEPANAGVPGFCRHAAILRLQPSPEWKTWIDGVAGKWIEQEAFAEFLEEHNIDVVEPAGAELYEIALTLRATVNAEFQKGVDLGNGDVNLKYVHTTTATAGQDGVLEIPNAVTLFIPAYQGMEPVRVNCLLRYRLRGGNVVFALRPVRADRLLMEICEGVVEQIDRETSITPFVGEFSR